MKNKDAIIEKLMLNRAALMMKRFDKELKDALITELKNLRPNQFISNNNLNKRLTA